MPKTQLPEYSSLVRWTVQDVANWLVKNGFNDCTRIFREAGVDGNKLVNLTDADLRSIKCPNKRIKDLVKYINEVGPPPQPQPFSNRGFMIGRTPAPVQRDYQGPSHNDDGSGSEAEVEVWSDSEFDSADEGSDQSYEEPMENLAPVAPPRPARDDKFSRPPLPTPVHQHQVRPGPEPGPGRRKKLPPPQYEQDENYEEPDAGLSAPPPLVPSLPTRRKAPSPTLVQEETYEDPDAGLPSTAVPVLPTRRKAPSPPLVQEDTYEDPDAGLQTAPAFPVPTSTHRRKAPSPEPVKDLDEYEEPDPDIQAPPPGRRPPRIPVPEPPRSDKGVKSTSKSKFQPTPFVKRPPIPLPDEPESQEVYEDPDSQVIVQPTHGGPLPTPPRATNSRLDPPSRQKHGRLPDLPVPPKTTVEPELIEQDVYEIPDEEKPKPPGRRGQLPPVPQESHVDDYLEMDDTPLGPPPPTRSNVPAVSKSRPSVSPRIERRKIPEPEPEPVEEECYEDPDATPEPPTRRQNGTKDTKEKKTFFGGVPILPGMKSLNVKDEEPKKKHPGKREKRGLPPPPSAEEPVPEQTRRPVKPDYVKVTPNRTEAKTVQNKSEESNEGDLESYPWFHGDITRAAADTRLKEKAVDGMYCIRKSSQGPDRPYVLVVFFEKKVYNLPVRRRPDDKYALGAEKKGEHSFPTLLEMVNFFKKNFLVIHASDSGQTRLVKSLPKS